MRPFVLFLFVASVPLVADEEASNRAHITSDRWGICYAKSVPSEARGSAGVTKVFFVESAEDRLLHTMPWFSQETYIACAVGRQNRPVGVSVVQMGPWASGRHANPDDLAIAFHFDGKLVRKYSTIEIAGAADRVSNSVSHYTVFQKIDGYRSTESNMQVFEATTQDGRKLTFDPTTGEIVDSAKVTPE